LLLPGFRFTTKGIAVMSADVVVASKMNSAMSRRLKNRGSAELLSADMRLVAGTVLLSAMPVAGLVVASRRAAGGVTTPLSAGGMAATVLSLLVCMALCDWLMRPVGAALSPPTQQARLPRATEWLTWLLPRLGLWACLWGVSGGGIGRGTTLLALSGAVAGLVLPWRGRLLAWRAPPEQTPSSAEGERAAAATGVELPGVAPPASEQATKSPFVEASPALETFAEGDGFLQQQIRRRTPAGGECIKGTVLVSFRTGDRVAVAHVGFCPPFQETPTVQLSTAYDEMDAAVAPGEILPWGIRVECRLEEAAEDPFDIPIDYVATATASPTAHPRAFLPDSSTP
jgi:hypothetical protein